MDQFVPKYWDSDTERWENGISDITYFALIGHRFDMRFFKRLNIAINETITYSNYIPNLIKDLNSIMIYHNWMIPEKSNSLMSVEFEYIPWKYFYSRSFQWILFCLYHQILNISLNISY